MNSFRVVVLLLVALLLPVRGVVAATMVCAEAGQSGRVATPAAHAHLGVHLDGADLVAGHQHGAAPSADGHHAQHQQAAATDGAQDGVGGDSCQLCASGCGVAALLTAFPATVGEPPAAQVPFPGIAVPALDFQLDGQDRPPRTI